MMNEWFGIKKKKLLHRRVVITVLGKEPKRDAL